MTALREFTADEIACLSGILAKLRPHGAPRWQPPGVRAALARVAGLDAANVLMAAVRLSQDRSAETPGQIAITSAECWRERVAEPGAAQPSNEPFCGYCGKPESYCRRVFCDDHAFEPERPAVRRRLDPGQAHAVVGELRDITRPREDA